MFNSAFDGLTGNRLDFYPEGAAPGDRRGQRARLRQRQQRRLQGRLRDDRRRPMTRPSRRCSRRSTGWKARLAGRRLSRRRPADRGRLAALHHARPLRRRSITAISSATAGASPITRTCRLSQGALRSSRHRRDGRSRGDPDPLLLEPHLDQPAPDRAGPARVSISQGLTAGSAPFGQTAAKMSSMVSKKWSGARP